MFLNHGILLRAGPVQFNEPEAEDSILRPHFIGQWCHEG